jgi:EpsI family protein
MPDATTVQRFLPAALLGVGCLLISGAREQLKVPPRKDMATIQMDAPGYKRTDIVVKEEERKIAGMSNYTFRGFMRDSTDPGFSVYVGYYDYQVQGKTIHSPKNCLPGAGWEAVENGTRTLAVGDGRSVTVNRYFAANTEQRAQAMVYYWYQGRGRVEANEYRVKWNLLRDAALYGRTEEALVRIVVPILVPPGENGRADTPAMLAVRARADSMASQMTRQLVPQVDAALPVQPAA